MKKLKPLNLFNNKGFWPEKVAIFDGIKEVLSIGKCTTPPTIHDYRHYRDQEWRDEDDELVAYRSIDWYVYDALDEERLQVDSDRILQSFASEPWRNDDMLGDHYDLFIMEEDMFRSGANGEEQADEDYLVGRAQQLTAAVVSTHRLENMRGLPYSYLKTEVMRQLCFMFGLPDMRRDDVELEGDDRYCSNTCILRPAHKAPEDWDRLTEDRIRHGALCEPCVLDLRCFFDQVADEQD